MRGLLPLAPLLFELIAKSGVSTAFLLITSAIYTVGMGIFCQNRLILASSLLVMLVLSFLHGLTLATEDSSIYYRITAVTCIFGYFVAMACVKFNDHVIDNKPFWVFE
jgi:intracellular septation protein A